MNPKRLNDKIQAINQFRWNQQPLEIQPRGTKSVTMKPAGASGIISGAFLEDMRENGLSFYIDREYGLVVYY